jgi:hypothetical protein
MAIIRPPAIATLALAAAGALAAPAGATGAGAPYDVPATQALTWPLPLGTTVVIDGPSHTWRMRGFAEELDAALPGVRFVYGAAEKKEKRLDDTFVVTVVKADRPGGAFAGLTEWEPIAPRSSYPDGATITLNTYFEDSPRATRRQVAAHELMHVLGFRHHAGEGVVGALPPLTRAPSPSAEEWAALHAYYG